MKLNYKAVIFDLDGTLVDTLGDIAVSMNRALKLRGFPEHPVEAYPEKVGWGIKRLAFLSLPEEARGEETAAAVARDAAVFYAEKPLFYSRPYPGITELVGALRQKKIKTAVLTNKPDPVAQKVVAGLFPPFFFEAVMGETEGAGRKPDPSTTWEILMGLGVTPRDTIFAGDSEVDMETALASGCHALGVSWGYRPQSTLEKAGAQRVIQSPGEILEIIGA